MEPSLHFGTDLLIFQISVLSSVPRVLAQVLGSQPGPLPSFLPATSLCPSSPSLCIYLAMSALRSLHIPPRSLKMKSEPLACM